MLNKRGQGLSTNAIILIVLGIIVLVILVVGFYAGWDKIAPWIKPDNNVQDVVSSCSIACSTGSVYDYCSKPRDLFAEDIPNGIEANCTFFSGTAFEKYGIEPCAGLC